MRRNALTLAVSAAMPLLSTAAQAYGTAVGVVPAADAGIGAVPAGLPALVWAPLLALVALLALGLTWALRGVGRKARTAVREEPVKPPADAGSPSARFRRTAAGFAPALRLLR